MLRSKDQILLESLYEGMIKESPDTVYDNQGNKIMWNANDAFTFGWFKLVPKIEPVYLRAASGSSRVTHDDLAMKFCVAFAAQYNQGNPELIIKALNSIPVRSSRPWDIVVKEIYDNKVLATNQLTPWKNLTSGEVLRDYSYIETNAGDTMSSRTEVFNNAGRIWLGSKIISFWNRLGEVSRESLDSIMNSFNVSTEDREKFLIDVVDPQRVRDESTANKKLPTVSEYFGGKKEKAAPVSKEDEKRIAELLAQKHTEADPIKRKQLQKASGMSASDMGWGSTAVAKRNPLPWRQAKYTSESYSK
jgi:hypothetical protein